MSATDEIAAAARTKQAQDALADLFEKILADLTDPDLKRQIALFIAANKVLSSGIVLDLSDHRPDGEA